MSQGWSTCRRRFCLALGGFPFYLSFSFGVNLQNALRDVPYFFMLLTAARVCSDPLGDILSQVPVHFLSVILAQLSNQAAAV